MFRGRSEEKEEENKGTAPSSPPAPSSPSAAAVAPSTTSASSDSSEVSEDSEDDDDRQTITNWSGTHEVRPASVLTPETVEELEKMISEAHREAAAAAAAASSSSSPSSSPSSPRRKVRCVGSALSPNGLAFEEQGMISLSLLDRILEIDESNKTVRVEGGARVQSVADALRSKGLTLPVYASIREQSIGGYCQAGVHGTGATIGPADDFVSRLKLVTPAEGTLTLSDDATTETEENLSLFYLARVGLGALGAVAEATIRCDPLTWLEEETFVLTRAEAVRRKEELIRRHRHCRFMWIPHADAVVVVALDKAEPPSKAGEEKKKAEGDEEAAAAVAASASTRARAPLEALVPEARRRRAAFSSSSSSSSDSSSASSEDSLEDLSPMLLRQWLLSSSPLDASWVKRIAEAEAEHWRRAAGKRRGWSDEMLGFDCAGAQWVLEAAVPAGELGKQSGNEMEFMAELLARIEGGGDDNGKENGDGGGGAGAGKWPGNLIPAHAPIEQRWTAGSRSLLSPVSDAAGSSSKGPSLHSWVGIILYLPEDEASSKEWRAKVDAAFEKYSRVVERELGPRHGATEHWAKVEPGRYIDKSGDSVEDRAPLLEKRRQLAERFGEGNVAKFAEARKRLDPFNVMGGGVVDQLFPHPNDEKEEKK